MDQKNPPFPRFTDHAPGTAPGTLVPPENAQPTTIDVIAFSETDLKEMKNLAAADLEAMRGQWPMLWVNVEGLQDQTSIEAIGKMFGLHMLALEDVMSPYQRPKIEDYDDVTYIATRMAHMEDKTLVVEALHLFLGPGFLITFQEQRGGDSLDPVRDRLRKGEGRIIRKCRSTYLAYAMIDAVVDGYFPVLDHYGEVLDRLENLVLLHPEKATIGHIHAIRRRLNKLRHAVWPMRDVVNAFAAHVPQEDEHTKLYLRDCADHAVQALDVLEVERERASSLIEIYMSGVSNRMNEVMKVLTIIATIFIPLTFIVGVYGMNFDRSSPYNMPELGWRYGYPACLGFMALIAAGLIFYFYRKGWLKNNDANLH